MSRYSRQLGEAPRRSEAAAMRRRPHGRKRAADAARVRDEGGVEPDGSPDEIRSSHVAPDTPHRALGEHYHSWSCVLVWCASRPCLLEQV